jgi:tellurite methyltransferase
VGCGDGRNALFLAERGFRVDGFDISDAGIARLLAAASRRGVVVRAWVADMTTEVVDEEYDWIICHGVLHLIEREEWHALLERLMAATRPGGVHVCAAFTDSLPPPADLAPFMKGTFQEGELAELYGRWRIESAQSYILDDEHPGGIRHRHAIDKVIAWKPRSSAPPVG